MNGGYTEQLLAENKILSYKLDNIRRYIENRILNADAITKNEFKIILKMISKYEHVGPEWTLEKPLVEIPIETEDNENV